MKIVKPRRYRPGAGEPASGQTGTAIEIVCGGAAGSLGKVS
jgi:hypothetical protein